MLPWCTAMTSMMPSETHRLGKKLLSASIYRISIIKKSFENGLNMSEPVFDIRYLEREQIDIDKWDRCIADAPNGLIYARSFYLNAMAENWTALVAGDYEYVMPLTWKSKAGFKYLYQPYFTKTLGVFGKSRHIIDVSSFLRAILDVYCYWYIDLNE